MNLLEVYKHAIKKGYAINAFNFYNLETLQAVVDGAKEAKLPVICSVSESALKYMGIETCVSLFRSVVKGHKFPIFLHLDHGKSYEICKKVIDAGFDSVMIDGSSLSFNENMRLTKKVVSYAHKKGVFVEGELGALAGIEDDVCVEANKAVYTDPEEAKKFVEETKVDSLAIAIGTSHGAYKFKGESKLMLDILQEIQQKLPDFPLVLHGASCVDENCVAIINKNGGELKSVKGLDSKIIRTVATKYNIVKINVDTDLRLAFTAGVREFLVDNKANINPRDFLTNAKMKMKEIVVLRMKNLIK